MYRYIALYVNWWDATLFLFAVCILSERDFYNVFVSLHCIFFWQRNLGISYGLRVPKKGNESESRNLHIERMYTQNASSTKKTYVLWCLTNESLAMRCRHRIASIEKVAVILENYHVHVIVRVVVLRPLYQSRYFVCLPVKKMCDK